ncbi:MAG: ABC transporter ATP-binding protein/permease [Bacilli bacterium]|nr:ABC transporter ATP-binding protein/permease [Bacilli bacterium]
MFKIYKNFKLRDWIGVLLIIGLTVLQVYLTMTIVDYVQGIIKAVTFVNYHNNPDELGAGMGAMIAAIGGWDAINTIEKARAILVPLGVPEASLSQIVSIAKASEADIWYNGGIMVALAAGIMVVQALISVIASYVASDLSTITRSKLYQKVEGFSLGEIGRFSTPSLVTRATNDIQQIQMANLITMRMVFAAPITAIWAICKIRASSTELTVATAIAIMTLLLIIFALMLIVIPKFKITQKYIDKLNGVARENLTGVRVVRAFNAEQYQEDKFKSANKKLTDTMVFTGKAMAILSPAMMLIMNGVSLAIYWIGASLINNGKIDYPTVASFMMLASQIIMAFVMLMLLFVMWPRASVSAKRINEILETKPSILDPEEEKEFTEKGTVEFKNVSFTFPGGDSSAISNISFKANKGETIAIIGATGSGKTSIVNLIPRLYDASEGEVLVDGVNVKEIKQKTLRSKIGYVPQKGLLFKGTVRENIALGNPAMSLEDVIEAANVAEADSFINEKDKGYDSEISQGGTNVSGGQKQRLCIARAVAVRPEIYIFDDSFSALDYKTDRKVRTNLKKLGDGATKIIVAQRIGTIIDADKILVLENGKIVGSGTHQELLDSCSVYREIALSQLNEEELGIKGTTPSLSLRKEAI